jgi:hypothetical protein
VKPPEAVTSKAEMNALRYAALQVTLRCSVMASATKPPRLFAGVMDWRCIAARRGVGNEEAIVARGIDRYACVPMR